jgi:hypothetical protein
MVGNIRDRTTEFLLRFGDRGKTVVSIALMCEPTQLGDFSYKCVQEKIVERGYDFDPKMLLRSMEKDYGITETSYKSTNQHWWRFLDKKQVEEAISPEEEDPAITVVKIQAESLDMPSAERKLSVLMRKPKLSEIDKRIFRQFSFEELPLFVKIYNDAMQYEETQEIGERIKKIINMARAVAMKINEKESYNQGLLKKEREREDYNANSVRLSDLKDNI